MSVKIIILFNFIVFLPVVVPAQICSVMGKVEDHKGAPVEFATVTLFNSDSTLFKGAMTDHNGDFTIRTPEGNYYLGIQMLGFDEFKMPLLVNSDVHLEVFRLNLKEITIDEVSIVAERQIVRRTVDRLIFDAKALGVSGQTIVDVLRNVPGVIIYNDEISIVGKGSVKVLFNGREVRMSPRDVINTLKTYQSTDLDNVEVMTTPPVKYDAEGDAGIINIILKKPKNDFLGGNLNYTHILSKYHSGVISGRLNYNKNKITAYFSANGQIGKNYWEESNSINYPFQVQRSATSYINKVINKTLRGGMDVRLSDDFTIGLQAYFSKGKTESGISNETSIFFENLQSPDSIQIGMEYGNPNSERLFVNLHTDKKFNKNRLLTFDVDYFRIQNKSDKNHTSKMYNSQCVWEQNSDFNYLYNQSYLSNSFISSLDLSLPYDKIAFNFGTKLTFSRIDNQMEFFVTTLPGLQKNDFIYDENIGALYGDFTTGIGKKIQIKMGGRFEYTWTKSDSGTDAENNNGTYARFFPTLHMSFNSGKVHSINIGLTSRITRPGFNRVNPFLMYVNRYSTVHGNPYLKPSYTYRANIGYTLKNNFNVDLYYSYSEDMVIQTTYIDTDNLTSSAFWTNALTSQRVGVTHSYMFRDIKWMQLFFSHIFYYEVSESNVTYTKPRNEGITYNASLNGNFYLNKSKNLRGFLNGTFVSRNRNAVMVTDPFYYINAGLVYTLPNNKFTCSFNVDYLFSTHTKGITFSNDYKMEFNNNYYLRTYQISFTYNFGHKLTIKNRRSISDDIQNRNR